MSNNLRMVLVVALLFGLSTGVYEYVLPLYFKANGISYEQIGFIFALAGVAVVLARLYLGGLSDQLGRKPLYALALLVCGLASGLSALGATIVYQALLKTLRETAALTRETIHPIIIYEEGDEGFLNRIGKLRGIEFLFQAGGTGLAGVIIARIGAGDNAYRVCLAVAGGVLLLAGMWWIAGFEEHHQPTVSKIISLRDLLNFDLHRNLQLIAIAGIIFTFGVQLSHGFFMVLFFHDRFNLPDNQVAIIMVIHRLTIALPMLIVGNLKLKNMKGWLISGYIIQGITVLASAVIPHVWIAAAVFLLHDLIGAGIWSPIQTTMIQRYSRNASRGLEVGKVLTWTSIGSIFGPLFSGYFATFDVRLPFFASGVIMVIAVIPLFWLNLKLPAPDAAVDSA